MIPPTSILKAATILLWTVAATAAAAAAIPFWWDNERYFVFHGQGCLFLASSLYCVSSVHLYRLWFNLTIPWSKHNKFWRDCFLLGGGLVHIFCILFALLSSPPTNYCLLCTLFSHPLIHPAGPWLLGCQRMGTLYVRQQIRDVHFSKVAGQTTSTQEYSGITGFYHSLSRAKTIPCGIFPFDWVVAWGYLHGMEDWQSVISRFSAYFLWRRNFIHPRCGMWNK